jgi:hypothetical protein
MNKEELIESYTKRKAALELWQQSAVINGTEKVVVQKQIQCFSQFIEDLKNLPNELKGVSNNEDNKRICPNCRGKIKHVPYTNIIDTCLTCGGSGQI